MTKNNIDKTHENVRRLYQQVRRARKMQGIAPTVFRALNSKDKRAIASAYCELAKDADIAIKYDDDTKAYEQEVGGISFVLPKRTEELEEAGYDLRNCVGTYRVNALTHQDTIVFMKQDSKLVGCIEVMPDKSVRQAFGSCNTQLDGDKLKAFDKWCKKLGLEKKDHYGAVGHGEIRYTETMKRVLENFQQEHQAEHAEWLKELASIKNGEAKEEPQETNTTGFDFEDYVAYAV